MDQELDMQKVKELTIDLGYAGRTVIEQLALKQGSREGLKALELCRDALAKAVPNGSEPLEEGHE